MCVCVCLSVEGPGPSLRRSGDDSALRSLIGRAQHCHSPSPHTMHESGNRTKSVIKLLRLPKQTQTYVLHDGMNAHRRTGEHLCVYKVFNCF